MRTTVLYTEIHDYDAYDPFQSYTGMYTKQNTTPPNAKEETT